MAVHSLITPDVLNSNTGDMYFVIDGVVRRAAELRSITASLETSIEEFRFLHDMMHRHKGVGLKGSGSMTIYTGTPEFLNLVDDFKTSFKNQRFQIISYTNDPESSRGMRVIRLTDVLLNGIELLKHDTNDGILDQEINFNFDGYEIITNFEPMY